MQIKVKKKLIFNRTLLNQLVIREIQNRYKGSYFGMLWSVITPILMLIIYTYVFSVVFEAKWEIVSDSKVEFAMALFCGLNIFNLFSESVNKAPSLILNNESYVKKVVFPLEYLAISTVISSLFNILIAYIVLLLGNVILTGQFHAISVLLPIVIFPFVLLTLGISWFLSSIGVFIRDISNFISILTTILMFMSPIFYPISAIPNNMKIFYNANPITFVVEDVRRIILWGQQPNWSLWTLQLIIGILATILGYYWFKKTSKGFIDVI